MPSASPAAAPVASSAASTPAKIPLTINFTTAGLGGILGWICVHPFNTLAIRMNLSSATGPAPGFVSYFATTIREDGFLSLYEGLGAGITRQIFYATSRFGLFEVFRDAMAKYRENDIWSRLVIGSISGGCAAMISCPAEVSLVRISNDSKLPVDRRRHYKGVADAATRIVREEGVLAFWRGCAPFVTRAMLVGACQVGTYDQFKVTFKNLGVNHQLLNVFCASMSSGLLYSVITMPFETAKNQMASQQPDKATGQLRYKGTLQTLRLLASESGVLSLWKGFPPYYLRCGGHTVTMFIFVEQLRKAYLSFTT